MTLEQALAAVGRRVQYRGLGRPDPGRLLDVYHPGYGPTSYARVLFDGHEHPANVGLDQLTELGTDPDTAQLPMFPEPR